jgi:hypothetical protein
MPAAIYFGKGKCARGAQNRECSGRPSRRSSLLPKSGLKFVIFLQIGPKIGTCSQNLCSSRSNFTGEAVSYANAGKTFPLVGWSHGNRGGRSSALSASKLRVAEIVGNIEVAHEGQEPKSKMCPLQKKRESKSLCGAEADPLPPGAVTR